MRLQPVAAGAYFHFQRHAVGQEERRRHQLADFGGHVVYFLAHGVHHEYPSDTTRLVMPPGASIPLAALFFGIFWLVFGLPTAYPLFAGFLIGYLIYDYMHYYLHHFVPKSKLGKRLREQHMRHHFQDHRYGFGASSPVWDVVFRTLPRRRRA